MPTFAFWNVAGKPIRELIILLAHSTRPDVLVLAECDLDPNDLVGELNRENPEYEYAPGYCESLLFFTKFDAEFLRLMTETQRVSIRYLSLPGRSELILVGAHLPSKLQF